MSGGMKLSTLDFIRLLPQWMREDPAVTGLATGVNEIIPQLANSIGRLPTWDQIDALSEEELDDLAWELNILWYDYGADISAKRDVVKNSDKVYQRLGTKWAVESVIASYFTDGHIEEWFEYNGEPGRFRIHSSDPTLTGEKLASFLNLLYKVKRASAKLERIQLDLESHGGIRYGVCSELGGRMDVWPLVAREINATGRATVPSVLTYQAKMEIYPQGGETNV